MEQERHYLTSLDSTGRDSALLEFPGEVSQNIHCKDGGHFVLSEKKANVVLLR